MPDVFHLATALHEQADYFVTNDHSLLKLKLDGLKIHLLGEPLS
jgi:predicted nucleic acid-binding protein